MAHIYAENARRSARFGRVSYEDQDALGLWLQHYCNALTLREIAADPARSFTDRQQANAELVVAEQKQAFWARHPNFQTTRAATLAQALRASRPATRH